MVYEYGHEADAHIRGGSYKKSFLAVLLHLFVGLI
jgi:hypothetical protein